MDSFLTTRLNFTNVSLAQGVLICLFLGSFYVISLYLWSKQNRFSRNDPSVIKRRFLSVLISCFISLIIVYTVANKPSAQSIYEYENSFPICEWLGLNMSRSMLTASATSLLLTMVLFAGPIVQWLVSDYLYSQPFRVYDPHNKYQKAINSNNWLQSTLDWFKFKLKLTKNLVRENSTDLTFWRNYAVSPFTEEFVFRSCMLPLLVNQLGFTKSILIVPLFFGLAHLHHIVEGYFSKDQPLDFLIMQHSFQFAYTYVFGLYSSYLFLRTGDFFSCFVGHSFCNFMGFPNFRQLLNDFAPRIKWSLLVVYILGLVTFFCVIVSVTDPSGFDNQVFIWY